MKCRKKLKSLTTPSQNSKPKTFPRSFKWRISASFEGLDALLIAIDLELGSKYYVSYFSSPFSCSYLPCARFDIETKGLDSHLKSCVTQLSLYPLSHLYRKSPVAFHREFVERLESFIFESVGNIIEHRLLRLAKSQVYERRLTYRQRIYSTQILSIELIFTPCRAKLIVSYPARTFYFAPLKAKRYFKRYLEYVQNLGGLDNAEGLKDSKNMKGDGGYGESIMCYNFHSLQKHRVLSTRSVFVLR